MGDEKGINPKLGGWGGVGRKKMEENQIVDEFLVIQKASNQNNEK